MKQTTLIEHIAGGLRDDKALAGLFLGGSFGRGTEDSYSDIDFIALVEPDAQTATIARWRECLQSITPIVFWRQRGQGNVLVNAITADWLRCDLSVMPPASFTGRARNTVRPLIDRDDRYGSLPETLPVKAPDTGKVEFLIGEFLRVLGLLNVVVGRREYVTAVGGTGMLRDHLVSLMLEAANVAGRGGALHLSKALPEDEMQTLLRLPFPKPERQAVIDANFSIAEQFLPRARALAKQLELSWPNDFEQATLQMLARSLGPTPDWHALSPAS